MSNDLTQSLDEFTKKVKQEQYKVTDSMLKQTASKLKVPKRADSETLYSFRNYRYSNGGTSRNLKYKVTTKKHAYGNYTLSVNMGKDQNLAHLFEDGFDLKQRYGVTHIGPIMNIDFESESQSAVNKIAKQMNASQIKG